MTDATLPLVYSCSGCSNVAQLANDVAVTMDREGHAEMSCIVGVGGDVKPLVKLATSGRDICAIDGCPLACVNNTLAKHKVTPTWHFELSQLGVKKRYREDCSSEQHTRLLRHVCREIACVDHNRPV